ncbi:hypothetical protein Hanom_Chr09g00765221 [Helianthus anomalus]
MIRLHQFLYQKPYNIHVDTHCYYHHLLRLLRHQVLDKRTLGSYSYLRFLLHIHRFQTRCTCCYYDNYCCYVQDVYFERIGCNPLRFVSLYANNSQNISIKISKVR